MPIDISETALEEAQRRIGEALPQVTVNPTVGGLHERFAGDGRAEDAGGWCCISGRALGISIHREATALLRKLRQRLAPGDLLLLGVDHVKDRTTLLRAYNDQAGVTAEFNRNVLVRIARELGARFRPGLFRHRAVWNERESRVEMHLESLVVQEVAIPALDLTVSFRRGESIHTENSYKFTRDSATSLLARSGFAVRRDWTDERRWFGVYLAEAA